MSDRLEKGQEALGKRVDDGFTAIGERAENIREELSAHAKADLVTGTNLDKRLTGLEEDQKDRKWFNRAIVVGGLGMIADLIGNHIPSWMKILSH